MHPIPLLLYFSRLCTFPGPAVTGFCPVFESCLDWHLTLATMEVCYGFSVIFLLERGIKPKTTWDFACSLLTSAGCAISTDGNMTCHLYQ